MKDGTIVTYPALRAGGHRGPAHSQADLKVRRVNISLGRGPLSVIRGRLRNLDTKTGVQLAKSFTDMAKDLRDVFVGFAGRPRHGSDAMGEEEDGSSRELHVDLRVGNEVCKTCLERRCLNLNKFDGILSST